MVHPFGKRPRSLFGVDDFTEIVDTDAFLACRRKQTEWDAIYFKMSWWKRMCCFLAGESSEPPCRESCATVQAPAPRNTSEPQAYQINFEENTMRNEELMHRRGSRLNSFTRTLRDACIEQGLVLVKLRNGDLRQVKYMPADANNEEFEHPYDDAIDGGFLAAEGYAYWQANGESITGERYDIVEFDPIVKPAGIGVTPA